MKRDLAIVPQWKLAASAVDSTPQYIIARSFILERVQEWVSPRSSYFPPRPASTSESASCFRGTCHALKARIMPGRTVNAQRARIMLREWGSCSKGNGSCPESVDIR